MQSTTSSRSRGVARVVKSIETLEGGGFLVHRPFPIRELSQVDPFLMLDHLGPVTYGPGEAVGAPWHPHRGFQTVSYILQGEMQHRDSMGCSGSLRAGDAQWMTAGSGIIHDEEPSEAFKRLGGKMEGFQLWVNLPRKDKMIDPSYQDVQKDKIPVIKKDKFTVRLVAGEAFGEKSSVNTHVPIHYLDVHAEEGAVFEYNIPTELNAFVYIYRGEGEFGSGSTGGTLHQALILDQAGEVFRATTKTGMRFLLLAGKPLNEPVARMGPFVMNTEEELRQAFTDYRSGNLVRAKAKVEQEAVHEKEFDPDAQDASIV